MFSGLIGFSVCCSVKQDMSVSRIDALSDSLWNYSSWISVADADVVTEKVVDGTRSADGASWFVAVIKNNKDIKHARWMTTGLGIYDLYINGKLIGDEILKPGFTHYEKTKLSFTYDVTNIYNIGKGEENVLSAQVTPGWWADKIITPYGNDGMVGKKCAFRAVLELTYTDGTKTYVGTDTENWKAGIAGPVTHAAIFEYRLGYAFKLSFCTYRLPSTQRETWMDSRDTSICRNRNVFCKYSFVFP